MTDRARDQESPFSGPSLFPRELVELFGGGPHVVEGITRVILENTSDIIHVLDTEGLIRFVSASVERILGYAPEELVGTLGHDLVHPEDREYAERTFAETIGEVGGTRDLELRLRHQDGRWCTFAVRARIVGDSGGNPVAIVTSHEITERKQVEQELRQTSEMLRAVVNACPLPILMIDADGRLSMWSRGAERLFGWKAEEVLGHGFPAVPPEGLEDYRQMRDRALRGEIIEGMESVRQRRDGERFPVSIFTAPVRDESGAIIGTMALDQDITERKRYEQQRQQVLQFVSHDLRSPLAGVIFAASHAQAIAEASDEAGEIPRLLAGILRSAEAMNMLIRDLVDATRIEAGGLLLNPEICSVAALLDESATMNSPLARERGVQLEVDAPRDLEVRADRHRILQLLSNLVTNALRFTEEGGRVRVSARRVGEDVRLSVADTGAGIPEEDLPHVFDRFWQRHASTRGSAGLGLTIARGIAEAHGGRIWVESRFGEGSTFHVTIPARPG